MTTTTTMTPRGRVRWDLLRRHPRPAFLIVFNTFGQAAAFVPVVAHRVYGISLDLDLVLTVTTLSFLLAPALLITHLAGGAPALRHLVRDMLAFRVRPWWYLVPLIVVPGLTLVTALPAPPGLTVQKALAVYTTTFLPALLLQFVSTNWWEETVWTGFFQGPLQDRYGPWRAVLLTTPFFALQHLSLVVGGTLGQGATQFGLVLLVTLPTRALLGWIYHRTGSLPLVGLVHAASNAAGLALVPALFSQPGGGGAALLLLAVVVIVARRGRLGSTSSSAAAPTAPHQPR